MPGSCPASLLYTVTHKIRKNAMTIRDLISDCIEKMGLTPREITDRLSEEFALALFAKLGGDLEEDPNCRILYTEDVSDQDELPRHAWVFFQGRHYDAETPDGVKDWRQLPAFRLAEEA
jgi:hypothetical protein